MPPLPMLMSPLRYAVTRKSRAISALASPSPESFVSGSTKLAPLIVPSRNRSPSR